jgi:hypothetical protein
MPSGPTCHRFRPRPRCSRPHQRTGGTCSPVCRCRRIRASNGWSARRSARRHCPCPKRRTGQTRAAGHRHNRTRAMATAGGASRVGGGILGACVRPAAAASAVSARPSDGVPKHCVDHVCGNARVWGEAAGAAGAAVGTQHLLPALLERSQPGRGRESPVCVGGKGAASRVSRLLLPRRPSPPPRRSGSRPRHPIQGQSTTRRSHFLDIGHGCLRPEPAEDTNCVPSSATPPSPLRMEPGGSALRVVRPRGGSGGVRTPTVPKRFSFLGRLHAAGAPTRSG